MAVSIKPAGKIAIVVILVAVAFFVIKPLVGKKSAPAETEIKQDSLNTQKLDSQTVVPEVVPDKQPLTPVTKQVKKPAKPVVKPAEPKKEPVKPKKKGERENLDINF